MFSAKIEKSQTSLLKRANVRALKERVCVMYPILRGVDRLDRLFVPECRVSTSKANGNRFYSLDTGEPLFFEVQDRLVPTIYALWRVPDMLGTVLVVGRPVFDYLERGADLMLPGVVNDCSKLEPEALLNQARAVMLYGDSVPVAVGGMLVGQRQLEEESSRGKVLRVWHMYGDALWQHGGRVPMPQVQADNDQKEEEQGEEGEGEEEELSIDDQVYLCFAFGLRQVKADDLPLLVSTFYGQMMANAGESTGLEYNVKRSSFKKMSALLGHAVERGFVESSERSEGVLQLDSIDRSHDDYRASGAQRFKDLLQSAASASASAASSSAAAASSSSSSSSAFQLVELFRSPRLLSPIFEQSSDDVEPWTTKPAPLYVKRDVLALLWRYVDANELTTNNGRSVAMDELLAETLLRRHERHQNIAAKKQLSELFVAKLLPYHAVTRDGHSYVTKGAAKPIELSVQRRQGNKMVTTVGNAATFRIEPAELAQQLQRQFAGATTVTDQGQVILQGQHLAKLEQFLCTEYNVPQRYIVSNALKRKSSKKKRKR
jgi:translation initiation factor 2D